ncbi:MAG: EpsI family protein, partial [Rhodocyclaceae bacterium]|nr:EpsI family protein [Rhodocyclaceae bacterium]
RPVWPAVIAFMCLVAALWPGWLAFGNQAGPLPNWSKLQAPAGWSAASDAEFAFTPAWKSSDSTFAGVFGTGAQRVSVSVAYYAAQHGDNKAISSSNPLVTTEDVNWHIVKTAKIPAAFPSGASANQARLNAVGADLDAPRLIVWYGYNVGGRWTDSATRAKFWETFDLVRGRGTRIALVAFAALDTGAAPAADQLAKFVPGFAASLDQALAAAAQ